MKKITLFLLLLFITTILISQNQTNIARIKMFLNNTKEDTAKCELLIDLVQEYTGASSDSALLYADMAFELVQKLNHKKLLGRCFHSYGNIYYFKGDYAIALEYYFKSLKIFEELGDKKAIGGSYNNIGNVYWMQDNYDGALEFYFRDLQISNELGDDASAAKTIGNIGIIYEYKKDTAKALEYYVRGAEMSEKAGDLFALANAYINIGLIFQGQKKFNDALSYLNKAYRLAEETNNKDALALVEINLGSCYIDLKEYEQAGKFLLKGALTAQEIGSKNYLKFTYSLLSDLHFKQNEFKKSLEYYKLYGKMKDSIYNDESAEKLAEMQTIFETEKKQKQIEIQELKLDQQQLEIKEKQIVIYAVSGGLAMMFMFAFLIYRGYKQKQKINRELQIKNDTITQQKNEIEEKKSVIEEKNKDITDSIEYAKTLQDAILPDIEKVAKSLPNSFIFFRPRDIVSGDFYWYHKKDSKHFIIAADCTGHGVPGAFVSMVCNNLLNETIIHNDINDPGKILTEVNKSVFSVFQKEGTKAHTNDGMDVSICVYNSSNNHLEFAGAMNSALLIRNKNIIELPADKTSIGGNTSPDFKFSAIQFELEKNDCIYIFSDGFHDQFGGAKGKKFMYRNFKKLLAENPLLNYNEQIKNLETSLNDWQGAYERVDDILVIGFKV